jgi:uncharacterized protein (TIGR04255 family)
MVKKSSKAITHKSSNQAGHRSYKKNFLKQVIVRVDFAEEISIGAKGPPRAFYLAIKEKFPLIEDKKTVMRQLLLDATGTKAITHEEREWFYHGKERQKYLRLMKDHFVLEYKSYNSFIDLKEDFVLGLDAFFKQYGDIGIKRFGLRYVDQIELEESDPTNWSEYLNPALLAPFSLADDVRTVNRMFSSIEFNYGDTNLRFQFGMPNPDFPAPLRKKMFVLDYDAYCGLLLNREEVINYLDVFHEKISDAFEQVITDGLRKKMGVVNA